jgi:allantoin racemase
MKILNVIPVPGLPVAGEVSAFMAKALNDGNKLVTALTTYGPASIEGEYDEALAAPAVLDQCRENAAGCAGAFVNCFGDPGVRAARELLDIPVVGGFEPAMLLAMGLADKISIVTVLKNVIPMIRSNIIKAGIQERVASVRVVNIPVLELSDFDKLISAIYGESKKAIEQDGAEAIVLGCTGLAGVAEAIRVKLQGDGYDVPVVDPTLAAVKLLEVYGQLGLRPSKLTYMPIREKERL